MASIPNITLYTGQSPNGIKISIALEELGLPYAVRKIDMAANEQKSDWFSKINPNGRIPAIEDTLEDGSKINVWESGSILQYLVARYDPDHKISYPPGTRQHIEMTNWLFWQHGGVGPMQGQLNHFARYSSGEKIPYAIDRYTNEVKRLYTVLETQLASTGSPYIVGDKCTIADISLWGWISVSRWGGIRLEADYPKLAEWEERVVQRPAVEKGRQVPEKHHREMVRDEKAMAAFEEQAREFYRGKIERGEMTEQGVTK